MKKPLLLSLLLLAGLALHSQNDGWKITWHGMVNPVFYGDSREVLAGREAMMNFYPLPVNLDVEGNDLNAIPSLNMLSITARLSATVNGPDVLGAKTRGFIEGDFTGATDASINMFRLRHAYLDMKWQHDEVLVGQYWYPMVVEEIMPGTQPLNMGAPFHPYARYNQLRFYHRTNTPWEVMAAALFQLDNKSQGPNGSSTAYLKHSLLPEMNFQIRYAGNRLFAGAAVNCLSLIPNTLVENSNAQTVSHPSRCSHFVYSLWAKYNGSAWTLKAQTLLNNNLYEGCSMGGYVAIPVIYSVPQPHNLTTTYLHHYDYQPYTFSTFWLDLGKHTGHWRPGLFAGYAFNNQLNTSQPHLDANTHFYGRGYDIASLLRLQPRLEYFAGNGLTLSLELESTWAQYTQTTKNADGTLTLSPDPSNRPSNQRLILGVLYAF